MKNQRDIVVTAGSANAGIPFAMPWIVGLVGLTALPMIASLVLSGTRWENTPRGLDVRWVGAENFQQALGFEGPRPRDQKIYQSLGNTLFFATLAVPLGLIVSMALALMLNGNFPGASVFRVTFVLPYLLSGVATAMVWSWLFNPRFGAVNAALQVLYDFIDPIVRFAIHPSGTTHWPLPDWFYSPAACKPALILLHVWLGGGATLIFLAALQRVPRSLVDTAALDGARYWSRFRHVIWPHVLPAVVFNLATGFIFAMQTFDYAYLLFNREQRDGLLFFMLYLYRVAFEPGAGGFRVGYASAMAWILFTVIALLVGPVLLLARRSLRDEVNR